MDAHPLKTAWTGFYVSEGKQHPVDYENIVFDTGSNLYGGGIDEIGTFEFTGKYTQSRIKFSKMYTGPKYFHERKYQGTMSMTADGPKITGKHFGPGENPEFAEDFEMVRSKELEEKRNAAFKSTVARMKVKAGCIRLFGEDLWMALCKLHYLRMSGDHRVFTYISLLAGLLMTIAGPFLEARVARLMAQASVGIHPPTIADGSKPKQKSKKKEGGDQSETGAAVSEPLLGSMEEDEEYLEMLDKAKEITTSELFTGNLDYIAMLMLSNHIPAEVPDVAITDVIRAMPSIRWALVVTSSCFWMYTLVFPFVFDVPCNGAPPAMGHMVFFVTAFFNTFVQIVCASLTKYGYLMLVHAPTMYFFDLGLSYLGFFSSYSNVVWIVMVRNCGSLVWQPAAVIYLVGMISLQALPGIFFLITQRNLPLALRLSQNNLLVALLKPNP